jgi:hypothetical protein
VRLRHRPQDAARPGAAVTHEHLDREHSVQELGPGPAARDWRRCRCIGRRRRRYNGRAPASAGSRSILPRERRRSPCTTAGTPCMARSHASDAQSRGVPARCSFASSRTGRRAEGCTNPGSCRGLVMFVQQTGQGSRRHTFACTAEAIGSRGPSGGDNLSPRCGRSAL